ncbi:uncharacterized protein LOC62_01G000561 [Vanrija pseudolonga]|uniref:HORMA domain-containing protein n=1 Tax=Vanrija pseudolonga TaxID=143232 RepID=A0AAF1BIB9_9TREE|nr:hypothetical protein LOC62_01G000561 [Vanrija pseudolonga]
MAHLTGPSDDGKTPAGGIYHAIASRYLKKLSFVILLDPNDRDNVIEAYTFDFSYCDETGSPDISMSQFSTTTSLESSITGTAPASAADLQMTMIISELPALPRQRYVDIRLQYTDDTPTECFESSGGLDESPPSATDASLEVETSPTMTKSDRRPLTSHGPKATPAPQLPRNPKATATTKTPTTQKATTNPKTSKSRKTTPGSKAQGNTNPLTSGRQRKVGEGRTSASPKKASAPKEVDEEPKTSKPPSKSSKQTQKNPKAPKVSKASKAPKASKVPKVKVSKVSKAPKAPKTPKTRSPVSQTPQFKTPAAAPPQQQQYSPASLNISSNSMATNSRRFDELPETNPLPITAGGSVSFQAPGTSDVRFGRMLAPLDFGMVG